MSKCFFILSCALSLTLVLTSCQQVYDTLTNETINQTMATPSETITPTLTTTPDTTDQSRVVLAEVFTFEM